MKRTIPAYAGFFILMILASVCRKKHPATPSAESQTVNSVQTIIDDMSKIHEAKPHGVPSNYNWALRPRIGMGNDPGGFKAMTAWGQLYEAAEGNPAANTRVQIRDLEAYLLSKTDRQWLKLQGSLRVEGAAYREDFAGDANKPADIRREPDGSVSVTAGGGYNFHFWPSTGRAAIDPADIGGILTTCQARLIPDDSTQADDRGQARYVLSIGGDYWSTLSAVWDNFKTNGDIGIGRFKYVRNEWQAFNMCTLSASALRSNPPPLK
jgi:hypothetical protein